MIQALNTRHLYAEYGISMGTRFSEPLHVIGTIFFLIYISVILSIVIKQTDRNIHCSPLILFGSILHHGI